jgi:hypothetical protein
MTFAAGLDPCGVLLLFGAMQILTGLTYGLPMPAQPLKAMAVLVITQKLAGTTLFGAGLAIGVVMLLLTLTGLIDLLAKVVPKVVIRGIQFGLGLQLAGLSLKDYVPAGGWPGYGLAALCFIVVVVLVGNRRVPPAPFVILIGIAYALIFRINPGDLVAGAGFRLPAFHAPAWSDIVTGFVVLAIPQIPLSLGNSILATRQIASDLFPNRPITARRIGFTYSLMNLINPFFGGIPTCHGSGGLTGHYTFGARTGGSVVIYGTMYAVLGLFLSGSLRTVIELFPKPVLGVILLFEALALLLLLRDLFGSPRDMSIAFVTGLVAASLPYGYVVALVVGTVLAYSIRKPLAERIEGSASNSKTS